MIYHIKGTLAETEKACAVIDCGGVGFMLTISETTRSQLPKIGTEVKLFTHMSVREDAMELFGFYTMLEKSVFRHLISVSGVGPKAAISLLSTLPPEKLALAVSCEDSRALAKAPGVGAKTAARIVLELKDKLEGIGGVEEKVTGTTPAPKQKGHLSEAQDALLVLGYTRSEALAALRDIDPATDLETIIKTALAKFMK